MYLLESSLIFDVAAKLCKAFDLVGWLILQDILDERAGKGVSYDPHDFIA